MKDYQMPTPDIIRSDAMLDYDSPEPVALYPILSSEQFRTAEMALPIILGINRSNEPKIKDLVAMPHLLVGGDADSGITSFLWNVIITLLYKKRPDELKFVLMDTSMVDFMTIEGLGDAYLAQLPGEKHCIINTDEAIVTAVESLVKEMKFRYQRLMNSECSSVEEFNRKHPDDKMPYLVVIINEYAHVKQAYDDRFDKHILHLIQKGRGAGIHLILSTSKVDLAIIDPFYLANFNSRVAFKTREIAESMLLLATMEGCISDEPDEIIYRTQKSMSPRLRTPYISFDTWEGAQTLEYIFSQQIDATPYMLPDADIAP